MYESNSPLFKSRSVLGRLSASFKFINDHAGLLLRVGGIALLPASLLWAVYAAVEASIASGSGVAGWQIAVGVIVLLVCLALFCGFQSLLYVWIKQFSDGEMRVEYAWKHLLEPMKRYAGRLLSADIVLAVVLLLCLVLGWGLFLLSPYTLIATLPFAFFVLVPFSYLAPVYILDNCSFSAALVKSLRMGLPTWGAMFAVSLVAWVVCGLVTFVGVLPFALGIAAMLSSFADFSTEVLLPVYFPFLIFLFAALGVWVAGLAHSLVTVAAVFQYGSAEARRQEWKEENQSL